MWTTRTILQESPRILLIGSKLFLELVIIVFTKHHNLIFIILFLDLQTRHLYVHDKKNLKYNILLQIIEVIFH